MDINFIKTARIAVVHRVILAVGIEIRSALLIGTEGINLDTIAYYDERFCNSGVVVRLRVGRARERAGGRRQPTAEENG